jgi:hypothetical protein
MSRGVVSRASARYAQYGLRRLYRVKGDRAVEIRLLAGLIWLSRYRAEEMGQEKKFEDFCILAVSVFRIFQGIRPSLPLRGLL